MELIQVLFAPKINLWFENFRGRGVGGSLNQRKWFYSRERPIRGKRNTDVEVVSGRKFQDGLLTEETAKMEIENDLKASQRRRILNTMMTPMMERGVFSSRIEEDGTY